MSLFDMQAFFAPFLFFGGPDIFVDSAIPSQKIDTQFENEDNMFHDGHEA
jgi:hypothetical protein